jgi:hypothetical protein
MKHRYFAATLASCLCFSLPLAAEPPVKASAAKPAAKARSFYDPVQKDVEGWAVKVEPKLLEEENKEIANQAFTALANHLQRIKYVLKPEVVKELQKLPLWIEFNNPGHGTLCYHPGAKWLAEAGMDPRLVDHVHIPRAAKMMDRRSWIKQPNVILHELAHAYHDQVLGFDNEEILGLYREAKKSGNYQPSLLYTGKMTSHYGMKNQMEYFAESSESYVGVNDFYPFVRAELQQHDPKMFEVMKRIWGKL